MSEMIGYCAACGNECAWCIGISLFWKRESRLRRMFLPWYVEEIEAGCWALAVDVWWVGGGRNCGLCIVHGKEKKRI